MKEIKNIHFIGIKGVGVAPLSIIAKEAGFNVTGCDISDEFITDEILKKSKITVYEEFSKSHLEGIDLVITTGAHGGFENQEVIAAKKMGIPVWTQGEAVGKFMEGSLFDKEYKGISVAGAHGKTTTTGMIASIFKDAGKDPSYVVGTSLISSINASGHFGKGDYFIAEADEYSTEPKYDKTPKFLWQFPKIQVITNIEHDHPDIYPNLSDMTSAFEKFTKNISKDGCLIVNGDDKEIKKIIKNYKGKLVTFGKEKTNDYWITDVVQSDYLTFKVFGQEKNLGEFSLYVFGEHNCLNALGACLAGIEENISLDEIKKSLKNFTGTKRRLEFIGWSKSGITIYDDYAHHPTEIESSLNALRKRYPNSRIICIFQPHTYSRTKLLFDEFAHSFKDADDIFIVDIYPSAREEMDKTISSKMLSDEIGKNKKSSTWIEKSSNVLKYLKQENLGKETIIVTMGAGDVYKIQDDLLNL